MAPWRRADRAGGHRRKSPNGPQPGAGPMALVLGALLDGIPESAAIGVSLLGNAGVGLPVVAAVFMSNIPESMSASAGLKKTGRSTRYVLGLWTAVLAASTLAAALGYVLLAGADPSVVAVIQSFAAGAILTGIVLVVTGFAWAVVYARMDPGGKVGQVVGNIVSEWTQILGLVVITKYTREMGSKEGN